MVGIATKVVSQIVTWNKGLDLWPTNTLENFKVMRVRVVLKL